MTELNVLTVDTLEAKNVSRVIAISNDEEVVALKIDSILPDLSEYAKKDEVPTKVSDLSNDANYATKDYVDSKGGDLSQYAKKSEIPTKVSQLANDSDYATKSYVDSHNPDLSNYYTKAQVDSKIPSVPTKVSQLQNDSNYATKEYVDGKLVPGGSVKAENVECDVDGGERFEFDNVNDGLQQLVTASINDAEQLAEKQDILISGENIKTINGQSLLGNGNIVIPGGGSGAVYVAGTNIDISNGVISTKNVPTVDQMNNAISEAGQLSTEGIKSWVNAQNFATKSYVNEEMANKQNKLTAAGHLTITETTSGSEIKDEGLVASNTVTTIWSGTRAEYDAISHSNKVLYLITE